MKKHRKEAAVHAQQGQLLRQNLLSKFNELDSECDWDGTVNHYLFLDSGSAWTDSENCDYTY